MQHFLVELPFLDSEELNAFLQIRGLAARQLLEGEAGGAGQIMVKRRRAGLPAVTDGEPAQTRQGTGKRGGGFGEVARGGELQPGGEEQVVGVRLLRLKGPQGGRRGCGRPISGGECAGLIGGRVHAWIGVE